jgi:hypothetical protein
VSPCCAKVGEDRSIRHWTHWAAVISEKETGKRFAIDSSSGPNGDNPTVKAANEFYVPDDDDGGWSLPSALGGATAAEERDDESARLKGGQALGYAPSYTGSTR